LVISSGPVLWKLVVPDDRIILFPGDLRYRSTAPYAVRFTLHVDGYRVDWVFARTLLISGLLEPVGFGDVHISPCRRKWADTVQIALKDHHAHAVLEAPARLIAVFLKRTCQAVPLSTEHRHLDLDQLVRRLLQDTG
jgi:hypothetical protein